MISLSKKQKVLLPLILLTFVSCGGGNTSSLLSSSSSEDLPISSSDISSETQPLSYRLDITKTLKSRSKKSCPSLGKVKALVVPVHFANDTTTMNTDLIKGAFDTPSDSDYVPEWRDVKSFYKESSYNKLNFEFVFLDTYIPEKPSTYYESKANFNGDSYNTNASRALYKEILNHFDSTYDYNDFDADKDGIIDCIYMIYDHPVDYTYKNMFWWAYTSWYVDDDKFDNVGLGNYIWCGLDFFTKDGLKNNTQTIIHETAHLFGVDDYYDYDTSKGATKGGLGGADLMDNDNGSPCGDHNAYTKSILGWTSPTVIDLNDNNKELIQELKSFQATGDTIILANEFNKEKEMYQEYFMLEYYTPTHLSERDKPFTISGVRVLHVCSQLDSKGSIKFNNTSSQFKLISQINTKNGETYINSNTNRSDSTLFTIGESLEYVEYINETPLKYKFEVIDGDSSKCTIKITLK